MPVPFDIPTTGQVTYTPAPGYKGADSFTFTVSDNGSGTSGTPLTSLPVTVSITVTNAAPIVASLDAFVNEMQQVVLVGSFTDANPEDTHTARWTVQDHLFNLLAEGTGLTVTWAAPDNGSYHVNLFVTDSDGAVGVGGGNIHAENVAPTTAIVGPIAGRVGQPRTFDFRAFDVSPVDQAGQFTYQVDWDYPGGTFFYDEQFSGAAVTTAMHTYAAPGTYTVAVKVMDKDQTFPVGPAVTRTITIYDPLYANGRHLRIFQSPMIGRGVARAIRPVGALPVQVADSEPLDVGVFLVLSSAASEPSNPAPATKSCSPAAYFASAAEVVDQPRSFVAFVPHSRKACPSALDQFFSEFADELLVS